MNGAFTAYYHYKNDTDKMPKYMSYADAATILGLDTEAKYPLVRSFAGSTSKHNVVVLIMESWGSAYVGRERAIGGSFTPEFDKLAKEGAFFTNCYAVEQRSVDGIQSIIGGIPPVGNAFSIGEYHEPKFHNGLGTIASRNGFDTIFVQTSKRRSYRLDSITKFFGFKRYFGMEDIPLLLKYPVPKASDTGWDYDGLMFLKGQLDNTSEPFLATLFSGTTHMPYPPLPAPFNTYNDKPQFGDVLRYSDYSLGEFIKAAKQEEWFKNTIFIITADHAMVMDDSRVLDYPENYHIPLLVYAPAFVKPARYDYMVSQLDILPTIIELAGLKGDIAVIGKSVFDENAQHYAFTGNKSSSGLLYGDYFVEMSENIIFNSPYVGSKLLYKPLIPSLAVYNSADATEELKVAYELLAYIQMVAELLENDRWDY
ncbi:hypothetical protein AGMMS49941_02720 [Deferribacterales bacterium]|nr:hypothetical protein AGMMS49941_02720 [Deferribacterales bacterium]